MIASNCLEVVITQFKFPEKPTQVLIQIEKIHNFMVPTSTSLSSGSEFLISIRQLSTSIASKAESKCSTVRILTPSLQRVVQRGDSSANSTEARIAFDRQTKYLPLPAWSGHNFTAETLPLCKLFPFRSMHPAKVCWSLPVCNQIRKNTLKHIFPRFFRLVAEKMLSERESIQISRRWIWRTWMRWRHWKVS